jgi:hypothetical protein
MNYRSGQIISLGDQVTYNGQKGYIALIGCELGSGCSGVQRSEWNMNDTQVLILFDNDARLMLDNVLDEDLLVFCERRRK